MSYTLNSVLRDVVHGVALSDEQIAVILNKLERDEKRNEERRELRKKQREVFEQEIIKILRSCPTTGFTATDVQFLIDDFMYRRITNQKVATYLYNMCREGKIHRARVNRKRAVYFFSENLEDCYSFPIYRIDEQYLKSKEI